MFTYMSIQNLEALKNQFAGDVSRQTELVFVILFNISVITIAMMITMSCLVSQRVTKPLISISEVASEISQNSQRRDLMQFIENHLPTVLNAMKFF